MSHSCSSTLSRRNMTLLRSSFSLAKPLPRTLSAGVPYQGAPTTSGNSRASLRSCSHFMGPKYRRAAALADARFRPLVPHAGRVVRRAAEGSRLRVALQPAEVLVADLDRLLVRSGTKDDAARFGERGVDDDGQPEETPERRLCSGLAAGEEALEGRFIQQPHRRNTQDAREELLVDHFRSGEDGDPDLVATFDDHGFHHPPPGHVHGRRQLLRSAGAPMRVPFVGNVMLFEEIDDLPGDHGVPPSVSRGTVRAASPSAKPTELSYHMLCNGNGLLSA